MAKNTDLNPLAQALSDYNLYDNPEVIKLKSRVLNGVLGGGLPIGSVIQLAASSGSGKSTIALDISRELCELGKTVLYIDSEKGLNPSQLVGTGVEPYRLNTDPKKGKFFIIREYNCNRIFQALRDIVPPKNKQGKATGKALVDCVVLDSLGALDAGLYDDTNADITVQRVGGTTKALKQLMLKINALAIDYHITFIIINHTLKDINAFFPTDRPVGGDTPKFLSDALIKLSPLGKPICNVNGIPVAQKVQAEALKSRFGVGKVKKPFYIRLGKGISNLYTYQDLLQEIPTDFNGETKKVLTITPGSSSNHLYLNGKDYSFQGKDNAIKLIIEHYNEIDKLIEQGDYFSISTDENTSSVLVTSSEAEEDSLEDLSELESLE